MSTRPDPADVDLIASVLEKYHPGETNAFELTEDPDGVGDQRLAVRVTADNFIVHGPTGPELLKRLERVLAHRAEHGAPNHVVNPGDHVAEPGDHAIGARFVPDPRIPDDAKAAIAGGSAAMNAAGEESRPAPSAPALLDEEQYGAVRAHVIKLTQAMTVLDASAIARLIATGIEGEKHSEAELILGGMTAQQAKEAKQALALELDLFRAYASFRRRVDRIQADAQAAMPTVATGPTAPSRPGANGRTPPPRPPRKARK